MFGNIQSLLDKELSRKDFIKLLALMLVSLLGIQNFLQYMLNNMKNTPQATQLGDPADHGFGSRKFGR